MPGPAQRESPLVIFLKAFPPRIIGAMVLQIAVLNGVLMIGAVFLGMALDGELGTRPLLTVALPVMAAAIAVLIAWRLALATAQRSRQAYLRWAQSCATPPAGDTPSQTLVQVNPNTEL